MGVNNQYCPKFCLRGLYTTPLAVRPIYFRKPTFIRATQNLVIYCWDGFGFDLLRQNNFKLTANTYRMMKYKIFVDMSQLRCIAKPWLLADYPFGKALY